MSLCAKLMKINAGWIIRYHANCESKGVAMRRLVTATDDDGRSYVQSDTDIDVTGFGTMLWVADPAEQPPWMAGITDADVPPIEPPRSGSHAMVVTLPPPGEGPPPPTIPGIGDDGFHLTRTTDYVLVVSGRIRLQLDTTSVVLSAGDLVVQQGTNHAWHNDGTKPATFFVVATSALDPQPAPATDTEEDQP